jgi:O-antigen/teichoic acid export membrane protein
VGRGELATIVFWPSLIATLGLFGVNWALARRAGQDPAGTVKLVRVAVVWGIVGGSVFLILGWLALPIVLQPHETGLLWAARLFLLTVPLNFVGLNLLGLDQGAARFGSYNLARLVFYPIYLGIILIAWWAGTASVLLFVVAHLTANALTVGFRLARWWGSLRSSRIDHGLAMGLLRESVPFGLAVVMRAAAQQVDLLLAILLLDATHVGLYAAALAFASVHAPVAAALGVVVFAEGSAARSPGDIGRRMAHTLRQAFLLNLAGTMVVGGLAPLLVVPLFGIGFHASVAPCQVLAIATGLGAMAAILNELLRGAGQPRPGMVGQGLGALATAGVGATLVPSIGLMGIAVAAMVGNGLHCVVVLGWAWWRFGPGVRPASWLRERSHA